MLVSHDRGYGDKKMKSDVNVLKAYMNMLLDGTAFCNWKNPPTRQQRYDLVESIMSNKNYRGQPLDMNRIKKVITESQSTKQLKRLMEEMLIGEDEFKV